jgi:hypothetical protein
MLRTFEKYLINVGIRSHEFSYRDEELFGYIEYFRESFERNISPYKALLFLQNYIEGDYSF